MALLTGVSLVVISIVMLAMALPRHGEVVGFLRDRDLLQSTYMMVVVALFSAGVFIAISDLSLFR